MVNFMSSPRQACFCCDCAKYLQLFSDCMLTSAVVHLHDNAQPFLGWQFKWKLKSIKPSRHRDAASLSNLRGLVSSIVQTSLTWLHWWCFTELRDILTWLLAFLKILYKL